MKFSDLILLISLFLNLLAVIIPLLVWIKSRPTKVKINEWILLRQKEEDGYRLMLQFLNLHKDIIRLTKVYIFIKSTPFSLYENVISFDCRLPVNLKRGDFFNITIDLQKLSKLKKQISKKIEICFYDQYSDTTVKKIITKRKLKRLFDFMNFD